MAVAYTLRINGIRMYITAQQLALWNVADTAVMACDREFCLSVNSRILCNHSCGNGFEGSTERFGVQKWKFLQNPLKGVRRVNRTHQT